MTTVTIFRAKSGSICGFTAEDHGDPLVCAAVSALTINAVNSIETFAPEEPLVYAYDEAGGFLRCELPAVKAGGHNAAADLLLRSMLLGLQWFDTAYRKQLRIIDMDNEVER